MGELRSVFSGKLNGNLKAAEETIKQLSDCANRIGQAEMCALLLKTTVLGKVEKLEHRNRTLEDKIIDLEKKLSKFSVYCRLKVNCSGFSFNANQI